MKREDLFDLLKDLNPDLLEPVMPAAKKRKPGRWILGACATAAVLGIILALPRISSWLQPEETGIFLDPRTDVTLIDGESLSFPVGSTLALPSGGAVAPPEFAFSSTGIVVEARAVECLPDVYYKLEVQNKERLPVGYRLFRCETLQVVHGVDMPEAFWYLLPEKQYADLTRFDSLLISMTQEGTENYVIRNGTQSKMEALQLPVFGDRFDTPHLGNMIAFTGGVFDESLWQTESWYFGYQFGRMYLDCDEGEPELVVYRGDTVQQVIEAIEAEIEEGRLWLEDRYREPVVIAVEPTEEKAQAILAFVQPFENGVFSQKIETDYFGETKVTYRRYINGCETDETVVFDVSSEAIIHSKTRYTQEDLAGMMNIGKEITRLSQDYAQELPTSPNVDPAGKEVVGLNLFGWYAKADEKIYGIVRTNWMYWEAEKEMYYLDVTYTLYDGETGPRTVEYTELLNLVGQRNVYLGPYGQGIWAPGC